MRSFSASGLVGCGQTSATSLPSTMTVAAFNRTERIKKRRSFAFVRDDAGIAERQEGSTVRLKESLNV